MTAAHGSPPSARMEQMAALASVLPARALVGACAGYGERRIALRGLRFLWLLVLGWSLRFMVRDPFARAARPLRQAGPELPRPRRVQVRQRATGQAPRQQ